MSTARDQLDRAIGALSGLALGDALGMPTQSLTRSDIAGRYGLVDRLLPGAADQPVAPGLPAGSVTDDTEQALLLAEELIRGRGSIDPRRLATALIDWQTRMTAKGSLDLLGPSTRRAIELVEQGADPSTTGRTGTTNGAAMRIAPVGIACSAADIERLVDLVEQACLVTHHTSIAMAGAAAVAGAISAGIAGADVDTALEVGLRVAGAAGRRGHPGGRVRAEDGGGADHQLTTRIRWARVLLDGASDDEVIGVLETQIGTSLETDQSVVAALALASRYGGTPMTALSVAASAGGDTDTIAAIAGAVLGACHGRRAWPTTLIETVTTTNQLDLTGTARALLDLRSPDCLRAPASTDWPRSPGSRESSAT